nr:hypothetical protein [Tanacetum cinerariifolium]
MHAMSLELQALEANKTWTITSLPPGKVPIGHKWVYKIKCKADGTLEKYKAKFVAKGFTQKKGIDYHDTFAPEAKMVTIRAMLAIAIHNNCYADTSLFTLQQDNQHISLLVYVHDILITGKSLSLINSIKEQLHQTFSIKDLGPIHYYLGIEFLRNSFGLIMSQRKYGLELIQSACLLNVKPSNIPFNPLTKLRPEDGDLIEDPSTYRAIVEKLLYLTITRPDISYAAQAISQFSQASRTTHLKALVKVLRSSTETEYRALADTTCELTWLKYLLKDLGVHISFSIPIFCNNASAIAQLLIQCNMPEPNTYKLIVILSGTKSKQDKYFLNMFLQKIKLLMFLQRDYPIKAPYYYCLSKFGICDPYNLPTYGGG